MIVALYARVSTRDKGQETENQLAELRRYVSKCEYQIFREYVDHETGSKSDRAQFKRMFEDAAKKRFDLLIFWSLDRLSREGVLETLQYLNRLTSFGVAYRSYTEQYFDSCGVFKDAVISILATIAKQERIRLAERTKAGLALARARGKQIGRPRVEIEPAAIFRLRAQGLSLRAIGKQLGISEGFVRQRLKSASSPSTLVQCQNLLRAAHDHLWDDKSWPLSVRRTSCVLLKRKLWESVQSASSQISTEIN